MTRRETFTTLVGIALIGTLMQLSSDIYTPSFSAIAHSFSVGPGQVQMTMALFLAGVAITNMIYGPISEGIGRKQTILIGLAVALVGTVVCLCASSIHMLQTGRFIQGCGLGACSALWRSIFRDRFAGADLARIGSYLLNIIIFAMIFAPFIGGYIQQYFGWRVTFGILTGWILLIALFVVFVFKETSQHHGLERLKLSFMFKAYGELLMNREFIGFTFIVFLAYGGLFAWMTGGPIILMHGVGISPVMFGYLMIASGLSTGLGGFLNARLLKHLSLKVVTNIGYFLMTMAGISLLCGYELIGLNIYTVLIPAIIFILGSTMIFMNGFAMAFNDAGHIAGYAGSLYATIQQLGGAVFGAVLGHLNTHSPIPMAIMFVVSGLGAALLSFIIHKAKP